MADLPLQFRREVVSRIGADLDLDERVTRQAEWVSFRLRAAMRKR